MGPKELFFLKRRFKKNNGVQAEPRTRNKHEVRSFTLKSYQNHLSPKKEEITKIHLIDCFV